MNSVHFDLDSFDMGAMDFGAMAGQFMGSYLSTVVSMAGLVFVCICASRYKTFKNDKQMKNMFIAGTVLFVSSIVLPVLAGASIAISGFVMFATDIETGGALTAFMSSALLTTVLSVFSWIMKLGGCALVATVFFRLNQKKEQPFFKQYEVPYGDQSAESEQSDDVPRANDYESAQTDSAQTVYEANAADESESVFMPLGTLIVLWLLTFGIGYMYWVYRMTRYLNRVHDSQQMNPVAQFLLCGFVPFYSIYWFYIHGQKLENHLQACGKNESIATLCLILGIFCPFAAAIIMQDHCNKIACR